LLSRIILHILEEFKYFFSASITTSGNHNYSIIGGGMQGKNSDE